MIIRDAINIFQISQKNIHRKRTKDSYRYLLEHLENHFPDSPIEGITPDQIHQFLEALTEHTAKSTRRLRYAQLKAFFNFLINEKRHSMKNPCHDAIMVKAFKSPRMKQKETFAQLHKTSNYVIPAKAGIQHYQQLPGFRYSPE
jgi:site-specific recombinase XerD